MKKTPTEKRAAFKALHQDGCFVLPNPWDVGSARMLQHLGFAALASTSTGFAWTTGRPDYAVNRDLVLHHLRAVSDAVDIPVNADFESGFASEPEALAVNVSLAVQTGIAALSIEDRVVGDLDRLYETRHATERIQAARKAIDETDSQVMLVGRTEGLLIDPTAITKAIDKLVVLAAAGADCLYAGVSKPSDIAAMVKAVAPKPVNVLVMDPAMTLAQFTDLGVRRVSVGGALALVAWGATLAAAKEMKSGRFAGLANGVRGGELNEVFGSSS